MNAARSLEIVPFRIDELIRQVRIRPGVWNHTIQAYTNYNHRMQLWDDIGSVFGHANGKKCKEQWDKLKKNRAQNSRRQKKSARSGSGGDCRGKKYVYEDLMSFLNGIDARRTKSLCNLSIVPEEESETTHNVDEPDVAAAFESSMMMASSGGTTFRPIPTINSPNASQIHILGTSAMNESGIPIFNANANIVMDLDRENMGTVPAPRSSTPVNHNNSQISDAVDQPRRPLGLIQGNASNAASSVHDSSLPNGQNFVPADSFIETARERRDRERAAVQERHEANRRALRQDMENRVNAWRQEQGRQNQNPRNHGRPNPAPQLRQGGAIRQEGQRAGANWIDLAVLEEVRGLRALDDCAHLGMYIASRMRNLPTANKNIVTTKILEAITAEEESVAAGRVQP